MATETKIAELKVLVGELEADIGFEKSASYAKGFEEGKVSMGSVEDKIYSQVEVDGMISPLTLEIEGLKGSVVSMGEEISGLKLEVEKLKGETEKAVAAKAAEIMADFKSTKVDDDAFLAKHDVKAPVEPAPVETPVEAVPAEVPSEIPSEMPAEGV